MERFRLTAGALLALALTVTSPLLAQEENANPEDSKQAYEILKTKCYKCHGETLKIPNLRVLERDSLIADRGKELDPYLVPGKPDDSVLWQYIEYGIMPPKSQKQLTEEESALIKRWIANGAVFPLISRAERPYLSQKDQFKAISIDLFGVDRRSRPFQRYFSLTHLHNNPTKSEVNMRLYRGALSKAINSLSREPDIVVPVAVKNTHDSVYRIDLRDIGWDEDDLKLWNAVVAEYPYGIKPTDAETLEVYEELENLYDVFFDGIITIRADWFVAMATRPPLYHTLLDIPDVMQPLVDRLGVNLVTDFKDRKLRRGGVFQSGVSTQNRIVDRHPSNTGSFWISYDFFRNSGRGNVARFPLGPNFEGNPFAAKAFEHAGSEIVFTLPNGLVGFMLLEHKKEAEGDQKNIRINNGPVTVVYDTNFTSGSPEIVNGVSCMSCHRYGLIDFEESVRDGVAVFNPDELNAVRELYLPAQEMNKLIKRDQDDYLRKLEQAIGPFMQVGEDKDKSIRDFPEPISEVAHLYKVDMKIDDVAYELGFQDPSRLKSVIGLNRKLIELGLGPLQKDGGAIKRSMWEARDGQTSPLQDASKELLIGTPVNQ